MKKVNIKNKDFIVVPEGRVVKGEMPEKRIDKDLKMGIKPLYKKILKFAANEIDKGEDFRTISGVAYCDDNDEFNEDIGIDVCSAKLEMKNHRKLQKLYGRICDSLMEAELVATHLLMMHKMKADAIEEDMKKTYGRK